MSKNEKQDPKLNINFEAELEVSKDLLMTMQRVRNEIIRSIATRTLINIQRKNNGSAVLATT